MDYESDVATATPISAALPTPTPPGSPAEAADYGILARDPGHSLPPAPLPETLTPTPTPTHQEQPPMATNYEFNKATDASQTGFAQATQGVQHAADTVREHGENAVKQGQAAFAQASEKTREVMDKGMKAMDEFNTHARGNVDALMTASRAATQGLETMVHQVAEMSRKSFEQATAAMRTLASARTPQDVFAAQNEFVKAQFDNFVGEYSKLTETVMKVSNEVIQPLQSHMTEAAHKAGEMVKGAVKTGR